LQKISTLVAKHGKRIQYWGDIVLERPEFISLLPKDSVALVWGYEVKPYSFNFELIIRKIILMQISV